VPCGDRNTEEAADLWFLNFRREVQLSNRPIFECFYSKVGFRKKKKNAFLIRAHSSPRAAGRVSIRRIEALSDLYDLRVPKMPLTYVLMRC